MGLWLAVGQSALEGSFQYGDVNGSGVGRVALTMEESTNINNGHYKTLPAQNGADGQTHTYRYLGCRCARLQRPTTVTFVR
jgi:hypothetical protein